MRLSFISLWLLLRVMILCSCTGEHQKASVIGAEPGIIPLPMQMETGQGEFEITAETKVFVEKGNAEVARVAGMLAEKLQLAANIRLKVQETEGENLAPNSIFLSTKGTDGALGEEGYQLSVSREVIMLKAPSPAGLFYGIQTIRQLLPAEIESPERVAGIRWTLPVVEIKDQPRYSWRGLHLDVGRHFMPKEFIKKYLDNMAFHKLNTFHWHLTEDQGWRIEIKKYPKLTEVGAWRKETLVGHYNDQPHQYDGQRYGGFYTQEEVKEIVQYAKDRFIKVVPEIEMPGHAKAAIAAYPELGVTGKPVDVATIWGIFPDIYNVDEATFSFLEDVLSEVMALFPGEYIHIGGDEAIKDQWEASPKIQKRIKELGLKDEHELQSYFITRIEKFLNANGRKLIGWDEILEGGLAPNAAVMSWRGEEGGIAAAKQKHPVVMSPVDYLYLNLYQGDPAAEPLAFGGFLPLKKVYEYEPTPAELSAEEASYILGAQANVWTEYIKTPEQVEYMVFPRLSAVSEMLWSPREARKWESFISRMQKQFQRYDFRGIHYAKSAYNVVFEPAFDAPSQEFAIKLKNEFNDPGIYYTLDGSEPTPQAIPYTKPIVLDKTATIRAGVFKEGELIGKITRQTYQVHKAFGRKPLLKFKPNASASVANDFALTDGIAGNRDFFSGTWQGFSGVDLHADLDLGSVQPLNKIQIDFMALPQFNAFMPVSLEYFISKDGKEFKKVALFENEISEESAKDAFVKNFSKELSGEQARYVRVVAGNIGHVPAWHAAAGKAAGLLADEIIVE